MSSDFDRHGRKRQYAPRGFLNDLDQVIETVRPNPKRPGSKSSDRYARFHRPGQTMRSYIAAHVAAGLPEPLARLDLRWDYAHEFFTLADA
jgi:hypothetical protein